MRSASLLPGREGLIERLLARRAFLQGQDGAAVVVVDDRDVEPGALLEQLNVALHVALERGQPDQEISWRDRDREAGERHTAGLLGLLHQHARHLLNAAARRLRRQRKYDLDGVARRQRW